MYISLYNFFTVKTLDYKYCKPFIKRYNCISCTTSTPSFIPTFNPNSPRLHYLDLQETGNCTTCTQGWYCDAPGLLQPRSPCDPGYLCYGGAKESAPVDGVTGEVCIAGGYCPLGL